MKIIRAQEMGMCFGVKDALEIAQSIPDPSHVTVYGELVHNPIVNGRLAAAGFQQSDEQDRNADIETPVVLITAHGISNAEQSRLRAAGKKILDTTCPLVRRVHEAAFELQAESRHVLVIGKPGHVEVRGIVEDLDHSDVIESTSDVVCYESQRLGIVSQTTMPPATVTEIVAEIKLRNPTADIRFIDSVCRPTRLRQQAMLELLELVDAVVVVGGQNSNNTRRLVDLCHQHRTPVTHVQRADDLCADWFEGFQTVGLTAGTSTLDETIDEVHRAMEAIARDHRETASTRCTALADRSAD